MTLRFPRRLFRFAQRHKRLFDRRNRVRRYLRTGRKPWSEGYSDFRDDVIRNLLNDPRVLDSFRSGEKVPTHYGTGLDERVVEYPWVISRLMSDHSNLLDAGSAINHPHLLELPILKNKNIVIYTLAPEWFSGRPNVSHIFGDLRNTILNDSVFDEVVCISTLEHVGMDNTKIYTTDQRFHENSRSDYRQVMRELHRLLIPGGRLLLTVPFGTYQDLGWLQQFDHGLLEDAIRAFNGELIELTVYQYSAMGWTLSSLEKCRDCEYRDSHDSEHDTTDGAAAARAVACVHLKSCRELGLDR